MWLTKVDIIKTELKCGKLFGNSTIHCSYNAIRLCSSKVDT